MIKQVKNLHRSLLEYCYMSVSISGIIVARYMKFGMWLAGNQRQLRSFSNAAQLSKLLRKSSKNVNMTEFCRTMKLGRPVASSVRKHIYEFE